MKLNRATPSPLLISTDSNEVHRFAELLNRGLARKRGSKRQPHTFAPLREELRRLVVAWISSGHNTAKLFEKEPMLARHAQSLRAELIPTKSRYARLTFWMDSNELSPSDP